MVPPLRAPEVEVAAPTPVAPNWGGSAQLFGAQNGSSTSIPLNNNNNSESAQTATAEAGSANTPSSVEGGENDSASAAAKGKAPVATVEDAEDES